MQNSSRSRGVIYYNVGRACLVRLAVALNTMRRVYGGPVTILCDGLSLADCRKLGVLYNCDTKEIELEFLEKNVALLNKTLLHHSTPYDTTIFVDADTIVLKDFTDLYGLADEHEFVVPQFADWKSSRSVIAKRLMEWKEFYPHMIEKAIDLGPAINTGVFAFRRDSLLMNDWFGMASHGANFFIPDETCCQLMLPGYPSLIVGQEYNVSSKYSTVDESSRIVHFHGKKHCRIENGVYLFNSKMWYEEFDKVRELDVVRENINEDRYLRRYYGLHDSNRVHS